MKTIAITGTPGAGKSFLAVHLARKFKFKRINIHKLIKKLRKKKGLISGYDNKRKCLIINEKALGKAIAEEITEIKKKYAKSKNKRKNKNKIDRENWIIIDSHLSHFTPRKYIDICIVLRCNSKALKKRLKKRKYNTAKIRENLQAEIFDVCGEEARSMRHNVVEVDATNLRIALNRLSMILSGSKF